MKNDQSFHASYLKRTLLRWFDHYGRKNLPWQQQKSPYRVWVSEIMLQQTQVKTVIPYYERFMQRFPDIQSLATAPRDTVLHYWSGLGYYRRAGHLHLAAQKVMTDFAGIFPDNLTDLLTLPGIGRSTAGAILAIAYQQKMPILDGNVKRVLARLHGIQTPLDDKTLWPLAEKYTPKHRAADYTQAIMDLGATLCTRGQPQCQVCPFSKKCVAYKLGIAKTLPITKARKTLPVRSSFFLILQHRQSVLLQKRGSKNIWADLWSLPELKDSPSAHHIKRFCKEQFHMTVTDIAFKTPFRHTFTHFHLDITPVIVTVSRTFKALDPITQIWYNTKRSKELGIPAPVKLLINEIAS